MSSSIDRQTSGQHDSRDVQVSPIPHETSPTKFIFQVDDVVERRRLESLKIPNIQHPCKIPQIHLRPWTLKGTSFRFQLEV